MIRTIDNPLFIPKILELAKNISDTPLPALEKMLIDGITSKKSMIIASENKQGGLTGFIFATIERIDGEKSVFIQSTYIKPDREERYIGFEFLTKLRLWGKDNNAKWIYMLTKRNPKPFMKKYHFQFAYTMLKREV